MPELIADGLCIRPLRLNDAPALALAARESVATAGRWLPWCHGEFELADAESWVRDCADERLAGSGDHMGIFEADGGAYLGGVCINRIDRELNFANLGFWVRQSRQRERIATRAVRIMAAYGFGTLGLTRLEIVAEEGNDGCRRVAERAGAAFEGVFQHQLILRGTVLPAAMYALAPAAATPTAQVAKRPRG